MTHNIVITGMSGLIGSAARKRLEPRARLTALTRAIMSLSPPSGLNQPMRRQNSFDRAWRLSSAGPAISARSSAISSAVKSRP